MDKIEKFLAKLSKKDFLLAQELIRCLVQGQNHGLHITKLKGQTDTYRLRHGRLRIIYTKPQAGVVVLAIGLRNENTYKYF